MKKSTSPPPQKLLPAHILRRHWDTNRNLMIISGVVFAILLIALTMLALLISAKNSAANYTKQTRGYVTTLDTYIRAHAEEINKLSVTTAGDATKLDNELKALQQQLTQTPASHLGMVWFGSALSKPYRAASQDSHTLYQVVSQLKNELTWMRQFVTYNKETNEALSHIASGTNLRANALAGQEANWQETATGLEKTHVPAELKTTNAALIEIAKKGAKIWKSLAEAHGKNDTVAYDEHKAKLNSEYEQFKTQSIQFKKVAENHTKRWEKAYSQLQQFKK